MSKSILSRTLTRSFRFDNETNLLFQVICKRYDKKKVFSQWGDIFANDPVMASRAFDKLLYKSTIINVKGDSYRLKEKKKAEMPLEGGETNPSE